MITDVSPTPTTPDLYPADPVPPRVRLSRELRRVLRNESRIHQECVQDTLQRLRHEQFLDRIMAEKRIR